MADSDIKEVTIGSAAAFRTTINTNFDAVKTTRVYVGTDSDEAAAKLGVGGLWIVTESTTSES